MNKNFASDNNSGVHPKVMDALVRVNEGHVAAYSADDISKSALDKIVRKLGAKSAYFLLNGTGTNITIVDALSSKYGAILCTDLSHIFVHESGASAKVSRNQLLTVPSEDGKLNPELLDKYLQYVGDFHMPHPEVISIAQTTEMGAVYSPDEIKNIVSYAHSNGFKVHLDGARLSNACARLGVGLKEMTGDLGIDALSFGMCKNGLMFGECAVFFDEEHLDFPHYIKSNLQLQSKTRYIAAQYLEILENDLWLSNAKSANDVCDYFYEKLMQFEEVKVTQKPDSNMIFVQFPREIIADLQAFMSFNLDNELLNYSRLVCSFDSTREDVDAFIDKLGELLARR